MFQRRKGCEVDGPGRLKVTRRLQGNAQKLPGCQAEISRRGRVAKIKTQVHLTWPREQSRLKKRRGGGGGGGEEGGGPGQRRKSGCLKAHGQGVHGGSERRWWYRRLNGGGGEE
jgi:hypothetical protein